MRQVVYTSDPWFPSCKNTFTLFAAITHDCNQKCRHCFATEDISGEKLDDKWWYNLFDQLAELEAPRLFFTGGEPLTHPSLLEYASYASKKSIPIIIGTNATLITSSLSQKMLDSGIKEARVSLDGANSVSHDLLRGEGSFKKTLNGIRFLIETGIVVSIRTTVNKLNFQELKEIAEVVVELGVYDWEIKHIIPAGNSLKHTELFTNIAERSEALQSILDIENSNMFPGLKIKLMEGTVNPNSTIPDSIKVASCPAGSRMMVVQPTGAVIPCGYLTTHVMGNITCDSIDEIRKRWLNETIKEKRFLVSKNCKKCKNIQQCMGGCPAFNFCEEVVTNGQ
ncbi:MAG: radical SAM protein [Lachnospiraceae bacterium]|nr:radical SAM protein [Lachnospiraceae bacterium]MBR1598641.1 radical SAM protein [Lachnospiraceae bacterium]